MARVSVGIIPFSKSVRQKTSYPGCGIMNEQILGEYIVNFAGKY
jgi:hypothetical protein